MNGRRLLLLFCIILCIFISACRSNDVNSFPSDRKADLLVEEASDGGGYSGVQSFAGGNTAGINESANVDTDAGAEIVREDSDDNQSQMIIRHAQVGMKVKDIEQTQFQLESKVNVYGGYIVESNMYRGNQEQISAYISIRIPEEHFQSFLADTEKSAAEILERIVTGQDVTEDYVDLSSRLTSKRVVEERLLSFLKEAEKTEDLLKISADLANIQEDIEVLTGKMEFLENQSAFATVDLSMIEDKVIVPGLDNKGLNTWEHTKKQLATSLNFLLAAGSGIIVFFIGNLPIIILVLMIGLIIYQFFRRKFKPYRMGPGDKE